MLAGGELLRYDDLIVAVGPAARPRIPEASDLPGPPGRRRAASLVDGVVAPRRARRRHRHGDRIPDGGAAGRSPATRSPDGPGAPPGRSPGDLPRRGRHRRGRPAVGLRPAGGTRPSASSAGRASRSHRRRVKEFDWGRLVLGDGTARGADRVVSLPVMRGPALAGCRGPGGFVRCERDGTVAGRPG